MSQSHALGQASGPSHARAAYIPTWCLCVCGLVANTGHSEQLACPLTPDHVVEGCQIVSHVNAIMIALGTPPQEEREEEHQEFVRLGTRGCQFHFTLDELARHIVPPNQNNFRNVSCASANGLGATSKLKNTARLNGNNVLWSVESMFE